MCFTININLTRKEIEKRFEARFESGYLHQPGFYFNAFELPEIPVVPAEEPDSVLLFSWGLVPFWIKDEKAAAQIRMKTFNARAETITKKPSFREPFKRNRCLVICRGFYEWQQLDKQKIPYYIYSRDQQAMALAGIYDHWTNPETGEVLKSFSVITTTANSLMEKIHNTKKRMPVILDAENEKRWTDPDLPVKSALELLRPCKDEKLSAHSISGLISKRGVDKNVPRIVEPFDYKQDNLLF